jgi:glycerol 3-phosphatase-2
VTGGQDAGTALDGSDEPLVRVFDALLLDLDGVIYRGPLAIEHAVESIGEARSAGVRAIFVTNNANRLPETVAAQLVELGIPADGHDVMTSALAAAAMLKEELPNGAPVLAVGGPGLRTALTDAGFALVAGAEEGPVAVVQGFAPTVGWTDLAEAVYAIQAGARFIATNLDLTIPTERGIAPGNGAMVGVVQTATGVQPASAGKPQPEIFRQAAVMAGGRRPLMVGDRLDTDLAGAAAAGIPGLLVLTGVHDARAAVLAHPAERPRFLACDLRGLFEPHPTPWLADDGAWGCGAAKARVADGSLHLEDPAAGRLVLPTESDAEVALTLDGVRAMCCAAWAAADGGLAVTELPVLRVVDGAVQGQR